MDTPSLTNGSNLLWVEKTVTAATQVLGTSLCYLPINYGLWESAYTIQGTSLIGFEADSLAVELTSGQLSILPNQKWLNGQS